jgi:hypothetical protein
MSETASACRISDCPVRATGKCKNKFDPVDGCPDFGSRNDVPAELPAAPQNVEVPQLSELVHLPSGDVMHLSDVASLMRSERPHVVALVGEQQAGKTTLLASVYQQYCKGPFAGHYFAGSRTLTAFARRHHMSLLSSGRTVPTTPRTSRHDPVGFLHLTLRPTRGGVLQHLLLSDRSGEAFEAARTDTTLVDELVEVRQASRVCFLLDGGRFMSDDQRAGYMRRFKQMIRALHDNGALRPGVPIEILTTKIDKISKVAQSGRILDILSDFEANLLHDFSAMGIDIAGFRICALPRSDYSLGYPGLEDALKRWTAPRPPSDARPLPVPDAVRQLDRLSARWFAGVQP